MDGPSVTLQDEGNIKIDEKLEAKALRRVIAAYMNYYDAAEDDRRRWMRSYDRLSSSQKNRVPHLPNKYQLLKRCIEMNSAFILNMVQAFEPPFDISEDVLLDGADILSRASGSVQSFHHLSGSGENHDNVRGTRGYSTVDGGRHPEDEPPLSLGYAEDIDLPEAWDGDGISMSSPEEAVAPGLSPDGYNGVYVPPADVDKVRCIIRNIVRDWAKEGAVEREQCFKPILQELDQHFPNRTADRSPKCLVPGAGLARLALEISLMGFESQGNEFSYYMLICSSFILNHAQEPLEWKVYPWIHSNCNMFSDADQLRPVLFPDLHPASAGITEGFSMCAGDFVEVYSHPSQAGAWDAVVTCFFLDTAHNIIEYVEVIYKALRPGGVWINLGPLLYHFAEAHSYSVEDEMSLELCLEDVKSVALTFGFRLEKESVIKTTYTANLKAMMQTQYLAAFWTMIKDGTPVTP